MSYTFSATGLPPGLSLVGNTVAGTPSTPGNYTVTFTVSDGVSSVSEAVSVAIAAVPAPIPFWQLILSAESGCYARESYSLQFTATAESGSCWLDSAGVKPPPPIITVESGSYWRDAALAATAESGSYWRDSAAARPIITVESGSYWRDSFVVVVATGDAAYVAAHLPNVPTTQQQTVADAALAAATAIGSGATQYNIVDTLAARVYNWLCFLPGKIYTDTAGTTIAGNGDHAVRVDPWIGSLKAQIYSGNTPPTLTTSSGVTFDGSSTYLIMDTATYAIPAFFEVHRKSDATVIYNPAPFSYRSSGANKDGASASNEDLMLSHCGYSGGSNVSTNNIFLQSTGTISAAEINGVAVSSLSDYAVYNIGINIPNATGLNLYYAAQGSTSGTKAGVIGADANTDAGGSTRVVNGEVADFVILNATPTTTEKNHLTAFFKALWSIA